MKRKKIGRLVAVVVAMIMVFSAIPVQASVQLDTSLVQYESGILAQHADLGPILLDSGTSTEVFLSDFFETILVESSLVEEAIEITEELLLSLGFEERGALLGYTTIDGYYVSNADILLATLGESLGVIGFEGAYALTSPTEIVDVVVTFATPPSVSLQLVAEDAFPLARFDAQVFEAVALEAHSTFDSQLDALIASNNIEVFGRHNTLFNGVYMRVPAYLIDQIAALPEVFAVTPNVTFYAIGVLEAAEYNNNDYTYNDNDYYYYDYSYAYDENDYYYYTENDYYYTENDEYYNENDNDNELPETVLTAYAPTFSIPNSSALDEYIGDGEFNLGAIELFNIPYIHNEMGLRGAGIRVAVLDTGIDYRHPRFAPFRFDPADPNSGMPGANFVPDQGRPIGPGTSPNEGTTSNHGTHVAGTVIAMAPDITLYAYRVLGNHGGSIGNSVMMGIEAAFMADMDVINMSLGAPVNAPWSENNMAINVASLAGMITVTTAGNNGNGSGDSAGVGGWFSLGTPGTSALAITVGAGQAGGRAPLGYHNYSYIDGVSMPIRIHGFPGAMATELGLLSGETLEYVFLGRLEGLPAPDLADFDPADVVARAAQISATHLGGGDLTGRVAIIGRGGSNFMGMTQLAYALNATALVIVNDDRDGSTAWIGTGTPIDGLRPYNLLPTYTIRMSDGAQVWAGLPMALPVPGITGSITFGERIIVETPDITATFTSAGPISDTNHIGVDIMAPGVNIWSTNNTNLGMYTSMGGTSMAAPAIAGIAALLLEYFEPPMATRASEVKARMMNTAHPLTGLGPDGQYSVLQVGAGMVQPLVALQTQAFATVEVYVPFLGGEWVGDGSGDWDAAYSFGAMAQHTMASLDFGVTTGSTTDTLTVTINNGSGTWTASYNFITPTQTLAPPAGRPPVQWGPPLAKANNATMSITPNGNTFDISVTNVGTLGFAQGYVLFTNGTETLSVPFGANFVEVVPIEWDYDFLAVIRPILSNFVITRDNFGDGDPRGVAVAERAAEYFAINPDSDAHFITPSNVSNFAIGFRCPQHINRQARFYIGPYGGTLDYMPHLTQILVPNMRHFTNDFLSPVITTELWASWILDIHDGYGVYRLYDVIDILEAGVYTLKVVIEHDNPAYNLEHEFEFVVADERPEIIFDHEPITYSAGETMITVSGQVVSEAHTLAIAHNIYAYTLWNTHVVANRIRVPFDFTNAIIYLEDFPNQLFIPAADGSFSFQLPIPLESMFEPVPLNFIVEDGDSRQSVPQTPGVSLTPPNWPWISSMVSEVQTVYIQYENLDSPGVSSLADFFNAVGYTNNPYVLVRLASAANIVSVSFDGAVIPATAWTFDTTQDPHVLSINSDFLLAINPPIYAGQELVFTALFDDAANTEAAFTILVHEPLTPRDGTGIWRPILSNWVLAPPGTAMNLPRNGVGPRATCDTRFFTAAGVITMNATNYSAMTFGFNDPAGGSDVRPIRFYVGPYGTPVEEKLFVGAINTPANSSVWNANIVRTVVGDLFSSVDALIGVENGTILNDGLHTLTLSVDQLGFSPLLMQYEFIVVGDDRPTVTYDEAVFTADLKDVSYLTISGTVNSPAHELAIERNIQGAGNVQIIDGGPVPTFSTWDYTNAMLFVNGHGLLPVNADGTFSFEHPASAATADPVDVLSRAEDGRGIAVFNNALHMRSAHFSVVTAFAYSCDCPHCAYIAWRRAIAEAQAAYEEYRAWRTAVEEAERAYREWREWLALLDLVAYLEWRAEVERAEREYAEYRLWRIEVERAEREYREWRDWLCATDQCGGCDNCD